jgi:hypothetical protein
MNDSITGLGEFLASTYQDNINQLAMLEAGFSLADLAASFGLADDIQRIEDKWLAFAILVPTQRSDFLPQDLLEVYPAAGMSPEVLPQASGFIIKNENYPFTSPDDTGFISTPTHYPAETEREQAINNPDVNTGRPATDNENFPVKLKSAFANIDAPNDFENSDNDFSVTGEVSPEDTKSNIPSFERPESLIKASNGNISGANASEDPVDRSIDLSGSLSNPGVQSLEDLSKNQEQTSSRVPGQEATSQPVKSSDSIWNQPLQNLGDWAARIQQPVIELSGKAKLPIQSSLDIPGTNNTFTQPTGQSPDHPVKLPESILNANVQELNHDTGPYPGDPEFFHPWMQKEVAPEKQFFEQGANAVEPDTDDLLDALTNRILRDFHRYYP